MKKLILLFVFFFVGCSEKITITYGTTSEENGSKISEVLINKEEFRAPAKVYIQPYQRIIIDCGNKPCESKIEDKIFYSYYNGSNFIIELTTVSFESDKKNFVQVNNYTYVGTKLSSDAYIEYASIKLTIIPLSEEEKNALIKEEEKKNFHNFISNILLGIVGVVVLGGLIFLLFNKVQKSEEKNKITNEDILNHVDD